MFLSKQASVAQWLAHEHGNLGILSSNPTFDFFLNMSSFLEKVSNLIILTLKLKFCLFPTLLLSFIAFFEVFQCFVRKLTNTRDSVKLQDHIASSKCFVIFKETNKTSANLK